MTFCSNKALTQAGKLKDKPKVIMLARVNVLMLQSERFIVDGDKLYTCECVCQGAEYWAATIQCASGKLPFLCKKKVFDG